MQSLAREHTLHGKEDLLPRQHVVLEDRGTPRWLSAPPPHTLRPIAVSERDASWADEAHMCMCSVYSGLSRDAAQTIAHRRHLFGHA